MIYHKESGEDGTIEEIDAEYEESKPSYLDCDGTEDLANPIATCSTVKLLKYEKAEEPCILSVKASMKEGILPDSSFDEEDNNVAVVENENGEYFFTVEPV